MRLEIGAAPSTFTLDTESCALLVIDMQNDFGATSLLATEALFGWVASSSALLGALAADRTQ